MPAMKPVPDIVIGRLPIYLRALTRLVEEGQQVVASRELASRLGISSAQIRKDLSHFGEFGKQGKGYEVAYLRDQLRSILHADRTWNMALIGAGDLGHAIAHYMEFEKEGFRIVCVFDNNPQKIGRRLGRFEVLDMATLPQRVREQEIKLAVVAVPAEAAQSVVDELVRAGVKAILNYAPATVVVPPNVHVQSIEPVIYLQRMTYYL